MSSFFEFPFFSSFCGEKAILLKPRASKRSNVEQMNLERLRLTMNQISARADPKIFPQDRFVCLVLGPEVLSISLQRLDKTPVVT